MPRFAANLSMLFTELPFLDRFEAAARCGFRGVECLFPYEHSATEIARRLHENGLELVLFNLPPGNWAAGERGLAALPGREREFEAALVRALDYAATLGCRRLHAMAGVVPRGESTVSCEAVYLANLERAAERAAAVGVEILIEPLNERDVPGYLLHRQAQARGYREMLGRENLKVQMDLYHCQIVEGDLTTRLRAQLPHIGHVQIAGVPERHEPDTGEVAYPYLFDLLDALDYRGWVGCEYRPRADTWSGLRWAKVWGIAAPPDAPSGR